MAVKNVSDSDTGRGSPLLEKLTLEKCTKAQLIQLIKWLDPMGRNTGMYLIDLHSQQAEKILGKMDKLAKEAYETRRQISDILTPYDGKLYSEIPLTVLTQVEALVVKADKLDDEWGRLSKKVG